MPVTFQTDLRDIKDYGYVQQIPIEALFKNLGYKQAKYDEGARKMQSLVDNLVVKAYGQDLEKRDQILQQVNEELAKFSEADLSDRQVQTQLTNFVSKVASSKDFAGIAARTLAFDKLQEKKQKLTADGKTISPWNMQAYSDAEEYFAGNQPYDPSKRFTGDIYADSDFNAVDKTVASNTPEFQQARVDGKYILTNKGKVTSQLFNNRKLYYDQNPALLKEKLREFNYLTRNKDFYTEKRLELEKKLNSYESAAQEYNRMLALETSKPEGGDVKNVNDYKAKLATIMSEYNLIKDQYKVLNPEKTRADAFETWLNGQHTDFAQGQASYALQQITGDPFAVIWENVAADKSKQAFEYGLKEKLEEKKGNIKAGYDESAATSALDVWNDLQSGRNDASSAVAGRFWGTNEKSASEPWTSDDFSRTYDISTGIMGNWIPVQNVSTIMDIYGVPASFTTKEDGTVVTTKGKTVVSVFRSENPGQLLIIHKEGDNYIPQVVTTSSYRDAVVQRLSGSNFEKNKTAIRQKTLTGDVPSSSPGAAGVTGSTGAGVPNPSESNAYQNPNDTTNY